MRITNRQRLETAGFEFEQNGDGRWQVWLPVTNPAFGERFVLSKTYKSLATAVSAGMREMERVRARRDAYRKDEEWGIAIAKFDATYKETSHE